MYSFEQTDMKCKNLTFSCNRICLAPSSLKIPTGEKFLIPTREGGCPEGFSELQLAIFSILKIHKDCIAYWQLSEIINHIYGMNSSEGAVRGAMSRIIKKGFLKAKRCVKGHLRGNSYSFQKIPCPFFNLWPKIDIGTIQIKLNNSTSCPDNSSKKRGESSETTQNQDSYMILRNLKNDTIKYHWPNLANIGFGENQIKQILAGLKKENKPLNELLNSFYYVEYELENNILVAKNGEVIKNPLNWIFKCLSQGNYRRPEGYSSQEEQAESDIKKNEKMLNDINKEIIAQKERNCHI